MVQVGVQQLTGWWWDTSDQTVCGREEFSQCDISGSSLHANTVRAQLHMRRMQAHAASECDKRENHECCGSHCE